MAGQIYELMPKVARAIGAIGKEMQNKQQGWKFRGIDQVYDAAHKPLCDNGVFVTTEVVDSQREERASKQGGVLIYTTIRLKVTWTAPDGSSVSTTVVGEGMDSGDKSSPKAMSEALKYAYFHTFTIPLSDIPDPDSETHEVAKKPVKQQSGPVMTEARKIFNDWVKPFIDDNSLSKASVQEALHKCNNNYADAQTMLQMQLDSSGRKDIAC